ncbi:MAG: type II secretion system F family protein [Thaumarchaeota archaeon]|nr:type II secretion system F family protein [Nitrososphaerota archaeon]
MRRNLRSSFFGTSYLLFQPYLEMFDEYFVDLRNDLTRSGLRVNYRAYVAGAIFASSIGAVVAATAAFSYAFYSSLPVFIMAILPIGTGLLGFAGNFAFFYFYPVYRANSRKKSIDSKLPYWIAQMAVLATAGDTPEEIFGAIAEEKDVGKVTREEATMIVRDMKLLGMDLTQALEAEKKRSPSSIFAEFLDGFIAVSKSGADVKTYLARTASSMLVDRRLKARNIGESVGVIAELYTILLVVTPLLLLVMFSVIGLVAGNIGGISVLTLTYLMAYLLVPMAGAFTLILADRFVSSELT